jgi:Domain of unknown function (DUF4142)
MKSLMNSGSANGTVRSPAEAEVEQQLDQTGREKLLKLRSAQPGREFDRLYLDARSMATNSSCIQEQYLHSGHNLDVINVAKLASGMIKEHLQLLAPYWAAPTVSAMTAPRAPRGFSPPTVVSRAV